MTSLERIIQVTHKPSHQYLPQNLPFSNTNEAESIKSVPKCFYHSEKQISFFCKNPRCTLPLCEKCLSVHRLQHLDRKEIPMQNVVTFAQCKKFILQELNSSKSRVKSNQKQFEKQLQIYKEKLIDIIESTLNKLKQELLIQDSQNSILKLQQLNQTIDNIQNQNSLSHIIKGYQAYYRQNNEPTDFSQIHSNQQNIRKHSLIDHIKFVPDQKNLIQLVERGFLNCKFVKLSTQLPPKINREQYLNENKFSKYQKTPIHKLETFNTNSKNNPTSFHQNLEPKPSDQSRESPIKSFKIVQIKRQLRKSIFNQKENNSSPPKSLSFNNLSKQSIRSTKNLSKEPLFSDVKKYNLNDSNEEVVLGKKKNIYTQNLNFESKKSSEYSFTNRSSSNSSLRQRNSKGLSLTRQKPGIDEHYLRKQRDSINKIKQRLSSENEEISSSRDKSSDWKRVVNVSESNESLSARSQSKGNLSIYHLKTKQHKKFGLVSKDSLDSDVLSPMEMRKLLMRKNNERKGSIDQVETIQKEYQHHLMNSQLHY